MVFLKIILLIFVSNIAHTNAFFKPLIKSSIDSIHPGFTKRFEIGCKAPHISHQHLYVSLILKYKPEDQDRFQTRASIDNLGTRHENINDGGVLSGHFDAHHGGGLHIDVPHPGRASMGYYMCRFNFLNRKHEVRIVDSNIIHIKEEALSLQTLLAIFKHYNDSISNLKEYFTEENQKTKSELEREISDAKAAVKDSFHGIENRLNDNEKHIQTLTSGFDELRQLLSKNKDAIEQLNSQWKEGKSAFMDLKEKFNGEHEKLKHIADKFEAVKNYIKINHKEILSSERTTKEIKQKLHDEYKKIVGECKELDDKLLGVNSTVFHEKDFLDHQLHLEGHLIDLNKHTISNIKIRLLHIKHHLFHKLMALKHLLGADEISLHGLDAKISKLSQELLGYNSFKASILGKYKMVELLEKGLHHVQKFGYDIGKLRQDLKHTNHKIDLLESDVGQVRNEMHTSISNVRQHFNLSLSSLKEEFKEFQWITILRRKYGNVSFDRKWADYENEIGSENGDYWIGLKNIHELTKNGASLKVIVRYHGEEAYSFYHHFRVGNAKSKYTLSISGYDPASTAGDSFIRRNSLNGMKFSASDEDHDTSEDNCAARHGSGGWWYASCGYSSLLGSMHVTGSRRSMMWYTFTNQNSADYAEMLIRKN